MKLLSVLRPACRRKGGRHATLWHTPYRCWTHHRRREVSYWEMWIHETWNLPFKKSGVPSLEKLNMTLTSFTHDCFLCHMTWSIMLLSLVFYLLWCVVILSFPGSWKSLGNTNNFSQCEASILRWWSRAVSHLPYHTRLPRSGFSHPSGLRWIPSTFGFAVCGKGSAANNQEKKNMQKNFLCSKGLMNKSNYQ